MHLHLFCLIYALAGALVVSADTVSARPQVPDDDYGACTAKTTATAYITVAKDAPGSSVDKIETVPSNPEQPLTNPREAPGASTHPKVPTSRSLSVVVVTSFVTVVPIEAAPTLTSTITLHSTVKLTQIHTVTKTLETSSTSKPVISLNTNHATPILTTVTVMGQPSSTVTRTLSLVKSVQTVGHNPGQGSVGGSPVSVPTRISKSLAIPSTPSKSVVLADESTVDIFQISHTEISLSVMMAKSGFMNNPGPDSAATLYAGNAGLPSSTLVFGFSSTSAASLIPLHPDQTSDTSSSYVVKNTKSSVISSSTFVSSIAAHTVSAPTAFSTLTPPTTTGSTVQYPSSRRYFNTTSQRVSSHGVQTSTLGAPIPDTSQCGEQGDFTLTFDDIPPLILGNSSVSFEPAPVFNPYHQFDFSDGFTVVPPPIGPFHPSSGPLMLEFLPSFVTGIDGSGPNTAKQGFAGQISDGDHGLTGCFTFNMYGAAFGCNSTGETCGFTFTGLHYEVTTDTVTSVTSQTTSIPACSGLVNCKLTPVVLDHTFIDLNAVQIKAAAGGAPQGWWMDDLKLGWFNNSCNVGLCRQSAHIR